MNLIETFLNHRRGCGAHRGTDCTCSLIEARAELARLRAIEHAFFNIVSPDGFHQCGLHEECPECENEGTHAKGCKLAAALGDKP